MLKDNSKVFYDDVVKTISEKFPLTILHQTTNYLQISIYDNKFAFIPLQSNGIFQIENSIIFHEDIWKKRQTQVLARINAKAGLNKKIFARKCEIKQIDKTTAEIFLNNNHLTGFVKCASKLGLYYEDELMAVATFSSGRIMRRLNEDERSYELLSYASKNYFTIVGGFDKLVKYFTKLKSPADIMTYIDKEWGDTKAYQKLGFAVVGETKPLTFYVNENYERIKANDNNTSGFTVSNQGNYKLIKRCTSES